MQQVILFGVIVDTFYGRFSPREGCELQLDWKDKKATETRSFSPREGCELQPQYLVNTRFATLYIAYH